MAYILNTTEDTVKYYRNEMIVTPKQALDAMHQYAMEKADEINKLNKSDVISSVSESGIRLDLDKMLKAKDTFKNIL